MSEIGPRRDPVASSDVGYAAIAVLIARGRTTGSPSVAFGAYLPSWARSDFSSQVTNHLSVPVKVIVGETDPALSAAVMEQTWLSYFPGAELEILASAGHYPMYEVPAVLATSIENFLGRE